MHLHGLPLVVTIAPPEAHDGDDHEALDEHEDDHGDPEHELIEAELLVRVAPGRAQRVLGGIAGAPDREGGDDQKEEQHARAGTAAEGLLRQSQVACVLINENRAWS